MVSLYTCVCVCVCVTVPLVTGTDGGDDNDDVIAINAKEKKKKKKKSRSHGNSTEQLQEVGVVKPEAELVSVDTVRSDTSPVGSVGVVWGETDMPPIGDSASSSSSRLSVNDEGNSPMFVALGTGGMSYDLISSEAEAAASATALVLSATTGQPVEHVKSVGSGVGGGSVESGVGGGSAIQMSVEELREAVLVLVKGKEELEEANK